MGKCIDRGKAVSTVGCEMKVQYVGRKPVPVLVGVELKHIEGDVFETDTPEKLPPSFQPVDAAPAVDQDQDPDGDSEPKSETKKSRKRKAGGES